jgi:hypothetical protein
MEMHADLMSRRDAVAAARILGMAGRLRRGSTRPVTAAWSSVAGRVTEACRESLGDKAFDRQYGTGFGRLEELCAAIG